MAGLLVALPAGVLADRLDRRRLLAGGALLSVATSPLAGLGQNSLRSGP